MELVKVLLSEIDLSSENYDRYLFNYERVSNSITDSIKKVGLINSVIIKKNLDADQTYIVVCGYQRILVCQELGWECIEAKVIDAFSDEETLLLALHDNLSTRGFNEIEKAIVLKKFMNIGYSHDRLISDIVPLLGIPQSIKIIDRYLSVLSLESEIKRFVAKGELELEKAFLLVSLDDTDKDIAFRILFKESSTNINEAKETIRNLQDLKLIRKQELTEMLTSQKITDILVDSKYNKRQKGERICKLIKYMRYPVISEKENEFDVLCGELGMDNDVRVNHSKYFEGDEIRITIKASNEEKLRVNLEKLISNIEDSSFNKIFSLFK
ncbi:MAG: ParB N-terminal domain-containing protein [Candidatus Brocadiaceae bacterium]|nr:ParB N-terminal domain-containing protein [Candidatus Brocadiaceae bacterium]